MSNSKLELYFANDLDTNNISYEREVKVIPGRKFTWDFYIRESNLLIEINGGTKIWKRTGHSSPEGIERDCEKMNLAAIHGFYTMSFTSDMVTSGKAIKMTIRFILKNRLKHIKNN
jgi:very-short-patch-repair endonuclease